MLHNNQNTFIPNSIKKIPCLLIVISITFITGCGGSNNNKNIENEFPSSNNPPIARAGADQNVIPGSTITLHADASTDPDHDALSYVWRQIAGEEVIIANNNASITELNIPLDHPEQTLQFEVSVSDGEFSSTDTMSVIVTNNTSPPLTPNTARDLNTYIFGHSLINHAAVPDNQANAQTNVPYWMARLSQHVGNTYSVSGQYGFLPQHANLPPTPQWGFESVDSAWDSDTGITFMDVDFNSVLITAANFIQYKPADELYDGDNPNNYSPVSATLRIIDWLTTQEPGIDIYIYENWPDMASFISTFPPTQAEFDSYNNYLQGDFHTWWVNYHQLLTAARPNANIRMIPVGPIISELLTTATLAQIPLNDLYEDDAPHGRATIYFLASLITYMQMNNTPTPSDFVVPDIIHADVRNNYTNISNSIWNKLLDDNLVRE